MKSRTEGIERFQRAPLKTHLGAVGGGELSLKHTHTAVRAFIVKAKEELEGQRGVEKLCVSDRRAGGRREKQFFGDSCCGVQRRNH